MPIGSIPGVSLARWAFKHPHGERLNIPTPPGLIKTPAFGAIPRVRHLGSVAVAILPLFLSACGGNVQAVAQRPAENAATRIASAPTLQELQEASPQFETALLQDVLSAAQRIQTETNTPFPPQLIIGLLKGFKGGFRPDNLLGISPDIAQRYGIQDLSKKADNFYAGGMYLWDLTHETGTLTAASLRYYEGPKDSAAAYSSEARAFAETVTAEGGDALTLESLAANVSNAVSAPLAPQTSKSTIPGIRPEDLQAIAHRYPGVAMLGIKELGSAPGEGVFWDGPSDGIASVMKVPIVATVLKLMEQPEWQHVSLDTAIQIPSQISEGGGGTRTTIREAIDKTLRVSSNTLPNGLVYFFGGQGDPQQAAQNFTKLMQQYYPNTAFPNYFQVEEGRNPNDPNRSMAQDVLNAMNDIMTASSANAEVAQAALRNANGMEGLGKLGSARKIGLTNDGEWNGTWYDLGVRAYVAVFDVNGQQWIVTASGNQSHRDPQYSGITPQALGAAIQAALELVQQKTALNGTPTSRTLASLPPATPPKPGMGQAPTTSARKPFAPGQVPPHDPRGRRGSRRT